MTSKSSHSANGRKKKASPVTYLLGRLPTDPRLDLDGFEGREEGYQKLWSLRDWLSKAKFLLV